MGGAFFKCFGGISGKIKNRKKIINKNTQKTQKNLVPGPNYSFLLYTLFIYFTVFSAATMQIPNLRPIKYIYNIYLSIYLYLCNPLLWSTARKNKMHMHTHQHTEGHEALSFEVQEAVLLLSYFRYARKNKVPGKC